MKLRIGNTVLENNVILAPMAGVTDLPFRVLCREQGAGCVVTEMVSAKAVLYNNRNTRELLQIDPDERPAAVQLFGSEPDIMAEIAARLEEGPYDYIDVNMGCPVPKIVNNGEGSALMKNPGRARLRRQELRHDLPQARTRVLRGRSAGTRRAGRAL